MRRALVTGATGLVGSYIVERLQADGWAVRALVRDPTRAGWLSSLGAELVNGNVLDAAAFARAADSCEAIFHCAAAIIPDQSEWEAYRATNLDGTGNAIAAARGASARLLHLSSVAVYGGASRYRSTPTDETVELPPLPETAFYARSKRESEAMVLEAHARGEIWGCAVRPDVVYGKRDRQFVPRVARVLSRGFFPILGGGRSTLAIVHAANVADGAVRAVAVDMAGGKAYNLANDYDVTVRDFVRLAAQGLGRRVRLVPVPMILARAVFKLVTMAIGIARRGAALSQAG
ncbi:MAG: NAD(P)-dependent oxidoreductase, partial [Gemmatimonadota bacterium]|nr:NAD(P)-dependent oxidoreductase [Gemmatimonadota bacterium]